MTYFVNPPHGSRGCLCTPTTNLDPALPGPWVEDATCPYHGVMPKLQAEVRSATVDPYSINCTVCGWKLTGVDLSDRFLAHFRAEHVSQQQDEMDVPANGPEDAAPISAVERDARCPERTASGDCICGGEWVSGTCEDELDFVDAYTNPALYGDTNPTVDGVEALLSPGGVACTRCGWAPTGDWKLETQLSLVSLHAACEHTIKKRSHGTGGWIRGCWNNFRDFWGL